MAVNVKGNDMDKNAARLDFQVILHMKEKS